MGKLNELIGYAHRKTGPFAEGARFRVLIDLAAHLRQVEAVPREGPTAPTPEHVLWSLCQGSPDIDAYWLAQPHQTGPGAVHLLEPDVTKDHMVYRSVNAEGDERWSAIPCYRQLVTEAARDPHRGLETYIKAALSDSLRAQLTVTDDSSLLSFSGFHARRMSPVNAVDAIAVIGLYLRRDDPSLVGWVPGASFRFGNSLLAWSAVRSQIPSGWTWGSALVAHSTATNDDYMMLLFGSFYERLVRVLNHRDILHRATLQPATNTTGRVATEALDTMMFNIVGAFDATAIAAHMGVGRPPDELRKAGWQRKDWRKGLGVTSLYEMFHKKTAADDVLSVCRHLRNTVHGAGLSSMVSSSGSGSGGDTLVRLPQTEAADLVERVNRLASSGDWRVADRFRDQVLVDPARLVEHLLPHVFATLEEVVANTPLDHLLGTRLRMQGPPIESPFDLNTRTRACLLYGLKPPVI